MTKRYIKFYFERKERLDELFLQFCSKFSLQNWRKWSTIHHSNVFVMPKLYILIQVEIMSLFGYSCISKAPTSELSEYLIFTRVKCCCVGSTLYLKLSWRKYFLSSSIIPKRSFQNWTMNTLYISLFFIKIWYSFTCLYIFVCYFYIFSNRIFFCNVYIIALNLMNMNTIKIFQVNPETDQVVKIIVMIL